MVSPKKALECFAGAWGFLNGTIVNTTTGALLPDWHSPYPSGIAVYTDNGYNTFIVTANDTTEPEKRPKELNLSASPSDPDSRWALVGKYSVAASGPIHISNVTDRSGKDREGPSGVVTRTFSMATLPSWVGRWITYTFHFYDDCQVFNLQQSLGVDVLQTAWFHKLPSQY
ncbi:hypothetical protein DL98DRAFT_517387 [Cadophora sp. DSE1049]|nr:hypothetical protein DL98DRAFT_517387 [Cadophora sp. DSE1049]